MRTDLATATKIYEQAVKQLAAPGTEARATDGPNFADFLKQTGGEAVNALKASEQTSLNGLAGKADLSDIVTAVSQAEATLQTVVAIRDRVIQAYQDIMRMPM